MDEEEIHEVISLMVDDQPQAWETKDFVKFLGNTTELKSIASNFS